MSRETPAFGLQAFELEQISQILQTHPEVEQALIFGSRAKGSYKKGSDIDIALIGTNLEQITTIISSQLNEETLLPYNFDVIDYNEITNFDLKEHISRVGVVFYRKQAPTS